MSATYNLSNKQDYQDFYNMIIEDIDACNETNSKGYPIDDEGNPINREWLWEEFGHMLYGTQTDLGHTVFNEVLLHYNKFTGEIAISNERRKEIVEMARQDFLDAYECGQVKLDTDCNPKFLRELGLTTKTEQDIYTDTYTELAAN